ncbi:BNR repeat-like domain-containing protein [Rhizobium mongolense subsp. loessense]|uniref:BNR repeat-like domain-containing protein n=1 Tax=Rhizobium mongolense subsp. loessense TaxID=158890 RepID=A0A1G4TFH5_9HYPH|nr:BNR repeat-like domain-containing protein [Rhizobium mongolense subsp. loessense]
MNLTALPPEKVPALMTGLIEPNSAHAGRADAYLPSPCIQNHAANLAFLPDGTLSCVWFGGTMEGMGDISVYMSKLAAGSTQWSEPQKLSDDPSRSEQNPLIFNASDRAVWLLYTSQTSGDQDGAVVKCRVSDDDGKTFGPVRLLCDLPEPSCGNRSWPTPKETGSCRHSVASVCRANAGVAMLTPQAC